MQFGNKSYRPIQTCNIFTLIIWSVSVSPQRCSTSILRPHKFRGTRVVQKACLIQDERVVCGHLRERSADNRFVFWVFLGSKLMFGGGCACGCACGHVWCNRNQPLLHFILFLAPLFFLFKLQYILCLSKIDPALKTQLEGVFLSSMQIKLRCFRNVLGGKNLLFCSE